MTCRCGHPAAMHDHWDWRTYCGTCGCAAYRAEKPQNAPQSVLLLWTRRIMRKAVYGAHSAAQPPSGRNTP